MTDSPAAGESLFDPVRPEAPLAETPLAETPLAAWHRAQGGRMVPFAGFLMPVQYRAGIMAEHLHCRAAAALFDVSHMGQAELVGDGAAAALEQLCPSELRSLRPGRQRYGLLLNADGGIVDDLMVANLGDRLFLVVNASRKAVDLPLIESVLPAGVSLRALPDRALLALQGPGAVATVSALAPGIAALGFMGVGRFELCGAEAIVSRSGYTGEDGVEISIPAEQAEALADALLARPGVMPAGLGARDSLRLEAGLCLYGQDIDESTTPVEAGLMWSVGKRRRTDWDFRGAGPVRDQHENGCARRRVGLRPEGRQPARAETMIHHDGAAVGSITSGGFGPSAGAPVAMGYVHPDHAADNTPLDLVVRGRALPARVSSLPFIPHRYAR